MKCREQHFCNNGGQFCKPFVIIDYRTDTLSFNQYQPSPTEKIASIVNGF